MTELKERSSHRRNYIRCYDTCRWRVSSR